MDVAPVSGASLADEVASRIAQKRQDIEKAQAKAAEKLINTTVPAPGIPGDPGKPGALMSIYA